MYNLAEAISHKYGPVAATKQKDPDDKSSRPDTVITEWNHPTIPKPTLKQLKLDCAEYDAFLESKNTIIANVKDKHNGKKMSDLTDNDVLEYSRLKMAEELGLEL